MKPIELTPEQALAEVKEFSERLAESARQISESGEIGAGCSARSVCYREDKLVLYRYEPIAESRGLPPVLICYALVNRPYMMDLQPDRSLIRSLLLRGIDVYLIDWGYPDGGDRFLGLDDYINGYLDRCVDQVRTDHGIESVNLLGVCQGGTMSLCYAALHPDKVRNLITMVTPVDFHTPDNLLSKWARELDVDRMVEVYGNIPGELLNTTFLSLMPFRLSSQKYAGLADIADDPIALANFMRMEKWIFDSPDQAGAAFREFIHRFFQENRLVLGGLVIGGRSVDLRQVRCPVFNVYATQDHLVPPAASRPLEGLTGTTDYSSLAFEGGHIGIYVSSKAQKSLPDALVNWLAAR